MGLGHEKLDVYRLSIDSVAWVYEKADGLTGNHRSARDQWLRASPSIPLNIAEGNGKTVESDRRRYFEIASGSVLEYGAIQDVLVVGKALDEQESLLRKTELDRMDAMLSSLGGRGYCVAEKSVPYGTKPEKDDPDPGPDFDFEKEKPQQGGAPDANTRRVAAVDITST
jgi:four helix bundle protein